MTGGVAVTGVGIVSPIGFGRAQYWSALCEGRSGIAPLQRFALPDGAPRLAAEVRDFAAREFIASTHLRRMDNFSRMVVAAGRMALDDARVSVSRTAADAVGIVVGSVLGDISESVQHLDRVFTKGPAAASPMMFPNLVHNAAASYLAMELGVTGVNFTVAQGETSGEQAIILGSELVRAGRAELVLAGGGEELAGIVCAVYRSARALSSQRGGAEWSSPYDAERNGVILGEGAAMLVLESATRARSRGATILAEIEDHASFGVPAAAYDWPQRAALPETIASRWAAAGVDLVCGSANSSRRLDACEIDLVTQLLGAGAERVALTSIKGAVGEFAAAGALSAATACLALREQTVPPLCNLRAPEPGARLRFAAPRAQAQALERVLLCGIARGGGVAMIRFRRER